MRSFVTAGVGLALALVPSVGARSIQEAGDLRLPALFSSGVVLQRETESPLWGFGRPGESVEVTPSWDGRTRRATVDAQGRFEVQLETPAAGGPHRVRVSDGEDTLVIEDVLVGEVWICSGQSNMEWTLGPGVGPGVEGWNESVAAADLPRLRRFDVRNEFDVAPREDCEGRWITATPESAPIFSAVAFHFGRVLEAELEIPIGLLCTNWGGTRAEAWTSPQGLAPFAEFEADLARMAAAARDPEGSKAFLEREWKAWWTRLDGARVAAQEAASEGHQGTAAVPGLWRDVAPDLAAFDGVVWMSREVEVPAAWAGHPGVLSLGAIDDMDTTWVNGIRVGGMEEGGRWQTPRRYAVPAGTLRPGTNEILVRVIDTGGAGGFSSEAATLTLASEAPGAEALALAGEWSWLRGPSMRELGSIPSPRWVHQNRPAALYNAMLAPLVGFGVRGAIWYQGESNRMEHALYRRLFPALIADWRRMWERGDFPFYYVQIAPFGYGGDQGEAARLREAQTLALAVPNTGMAVTMDIGNPRDIHPRKKREVGERLANLALANDYGREGLVTSGPLLRATEATGDGGLVLEFAHGAGLTSRGEAPGPFTVAGADRVFHPAEARIDGTRVIVRSDAVPDPVAVRFAWGAADPSNLWNGAGLPATSFRSDDW